MKTNGDMKMIEDEGNDRGIRIGIVGAGGIGSILFAALARSLSSGGLVQRLAPVTLTVFDSDTVEAGNLMHQNFLPEDIGSTKVEAIMRRAVQFENDLLSVSGLPHDIRKPEEIIDFDIVVVAVDSPVARRAAHQSQCTWLDLRCLGDGFVALDQRVPELTLESMTAEHPPQSCQINGAIPSGNIQFGFMLAAAHGAQWVIQSLRQMSGGMNVMVPRPQSASITFGTLGRFDEPGGEE
ncbi:MAG: ThiF family adenylyltransferase [Candidatus Thalassarchaeaceae archaeon]|nr:ThiF family adenylyltransferase [Candidatus Thalassarchaeaceae archaeon]